MEVGRRVLDASQWECLDRSVGRGQSSADHLLLEESLDLEIVHQIVGKVRTRMTDGALRLPEEQFLTPDLALRGKRRVKLAQNVQLGGRWKVEKCLELSHEMNLAAAFQRIDTLLRSCSDVTIEVGGTLFKLGEVLDCLECPL